MSCDIQKIRGKWNCVQTREQSQHGLLVTQSDFDMFHCSLGIEGQQIIACLACDGHTVVIFSLPSLCVCYKHTTIYPIFVYNIDHTPVKLNSICCRGTSLSVIPNICHLLTVPCYMFAAYMHILCNCEMCSTVDEIMGILLSTKG